MSQNSGRSSRKRGRNAQLGDIERYLLNDMLRDGARHRMRATRERREAEYGNIMSLAEQSVKRWESPHRVPGGVQGLHGFSEVFIVKMPGPSFAQAPTLAINLPIPLRVMAIAKNHQNLYRLFFLYRFESDVSSRVAWGYLPGHHWMPLDGALNGLVQNFLTPQHAVVKMVFIKRATSLNEPRYRVRRGEFWAAAGESFKRVVKKLTGWK